MKMVLAGLVAAAFVVGCASHSTLPTSATTGNPRFTGAGSGPDVGQPGSPSPHWSLVTLTSAIADPAQPVLGPDGNIWFAGFWTSQEAEIGSVSPQGVVQHFPVPPKEVNITATTVGPDGNIWFTLVRNNQGPTYIGVGDITPGGSITQYRLPTSNTLALRGIATGSDGNLWITRQSEFGIQDEIDEVTTSGVLTHHKIGLGKLPEAIVLGPDGALWFSEAGGNAIGRITTSGKLSEFPLPAGLTPTFMVRAPAGDVWFSYFEQSTHIVSIGKIKPHGAITTYPNPQPETEIDGLAVGPDGALWFPASTGDLHHNTWQLRRITLRGVYDTVNRRIPLESPYNAPGLGIATGADGDLWVSEQRPSRFAVWAWRRMTVAPSSVTVGVGQTESIAVSETHYSGGWTAATSNGSVATVTPGQQSGTFVVHGHASGSCTVTISDTLGNFYSEPVTVQ